MDDWLSFQPWSHSELDEMQKILLREIERNKKNPAVFDAFFLKYPLLRAIKSLIENNILSYKYIAVIEKLSPLLKQNQESFVSSILKIEDLDELNIFYLILREKQNRKKIYLYWRISGTFKNFFFI